MNCFCYSITCGSCLLLERELEEYQKRRLLMTPGDREELWKEKWTPWDRNGPSLALGDVLTEREDLVPPSRGLDADGAVRVKTALVPGCGRGHDALLLASFGYRVVGLDYAESAIEECIANEEAVGEEETYRAREGVVKGSVKWVSGDFFADGFLASAGLGDMFDLPDQFLCALPPEARPRWAERMKQLLSPRGRLICLEFPSGKPLSMSGPPFGLSPDVYVALLSRPGKDVSYDSQGAVAAMHGMQKADDGLRRLELIKPRRTHEAGTADDGTVTDFISVWSH